MIDGTGRVIVGAGTTILTGDSSAFAGTTTIEGGTLLVTGSIASSSLLTVNAGATLGGTGTVGTTTVADGGTLSPGASIGTLTVDGDLTLGASSVFDVELAPASADRVNVTGTAALGGTLNAISLGGTFTSTEHTVLTAGGGISGTFNSVTTAGSFSGLVPRLSYTTDSVLLTLGRSGPINTTSTSSTDAIVFNTPTVEVEQIGLFETRVIGRLMGGTPLFDQTYDAAFSSPTVQAGVEAARLAVTTAGGPGVIVLVGDPVRTSSSVTSSTSSSSLFSLAGSTDAVTTTTTFGPATVTIGDARSCGDAIAALPGTTRPVCDAAGGTVFTVDPGSLNINTNTHTIYTIDEARTDTTTTTTHETWELNGMIVSTGTVHAAVQSGLFDLGGRLLSRLAEQGAGGWGEVYAAKVEHGDERETWGLAGGAGLPVAPGLVLGFGVDHGSTDLAVPGAQESGEVELTELGLSAQLERGRVFAALSAVYGFGSADTLRTIVGSSAASYDADLLGFELDFGYAIDAGSFTVRPLASLDYQAIETDGFSETGTLGLVAGDHDAERLRASAGAEVGGTAGGVELAASARYFAMLDGGERILPVAFALAPGTPLLMEGPDEGDSVLLAARARIPLAPGAALSLGYDGRFGSGYDGHAGFVGVSIAW